MRKSPLLLAIPLLAACEKTKGWDVGPVRPFTFTQEPIFNRPIHKGSDIFQ